MADIKPRGVNNGNPTRRVLAVVIATDHPYWLDGPTTYGWSLNAQGVSISRGQSPTEEAAWQDVQAAWEGMRDRAA